MNRMEHALVSPVKMSIRAPANSAVDTLQRIVSAESLAAVFHAAELAAHELGFDHFLYCARFGRAERGPMYLVESNEPQEWIDRYRTEEMWGRDPRFAYCLRHASPMVWHWQGLARRGDEVVRCLAESYGIHAGLVVPVHCGDGAGAMLCFDTDDITFVHGDRETRFKTMSKALCYGAFIHERVKEILLGSGQASESLPQLSAREHEVLRWLSRGKGAWEIAHIVGIAESTVYFHLRSLKRKLDVSNIPHAVARAMSLGIVTP